MFKNRTLLVIVFLISSFLVGMNNVSAGSIKKTCIYVGESGKQFSLERTLDLETNAISDYGIKDIGDGFVLTLKYDSLKEGKDYTKTYDCPNYLVDDDPYGTTKIAYEKKESVEGIDSQRVFTLNQEKTDQQANPNEGTYTCKYDMIYIDQQLTVKSTVRFKYTQNFSDPSSPKINGVSVIFYDSASFRQGQTSTLGNLGGTGSIPPGDFSPNLCPAYLVPTQNLYVDAYSENRSEEEIIGKAKEGSSGYGFYFKRSADQPAGENKDKEKTVTCDYYHGTERLAIKIHQQFSTVLYYSATAVYYAADDEKSGIPLNVSGNDVDRAAFIEVINQGCIYTYLKPETLSTDSQKLSFKFVGEILDPKKSFQYYRLGLSDSDAQKYKNEIAYAKEFLGRIIEIQSSNDTIINKENAVKQLVENYTSGTSAAPTEIQNMRAFLDNGGKVSKAIYDYANYWYSLSSIYSKYVVVNESCEANCSKFDATRDKCTSNVADKDCPESQRCINSSNPCLRFAAYNFMQYIEQNLRAGYIPYPDGCDMLSSDLISFLSWILTVARYATLVLVVILGMVDFLGAVGSDDEKSLKKAGSRFLKRILVVVFMFITAIFIQFILVNYALPGINQQEVELCQIA